MANENTETSTGKEEDTGNPPEHDYAHAAATSFTSTEGSSSSDTPAAHTGVAAQGSFFAVVEPEQSLPEQPTLSIELPEPAVGAEVDCPAGNEIGASSLPHTEEDSQKTAACELAAAPAHAPGRSRGGRRRTMRPEDKNCACCRTQFERQGRSFNRRAVYTFTSPETVHWAFPEATVHDKSFLCETCAQFIRSKCKRKQSGKRSLWLKPPLVKQVCGRHRVTTPLVSHIRPFPHQKSAESPVNLLPAFFLISKTFTFPV